MIPEDWSLEPIKDFASITTGGSDTQDKIDDGAYPFYVRSRNIERINKYSYDGEAILTSGDGVGVGKIFHYVNGKFDFHQRVYNIYNYRYNVDGKYLFFQFSTNFYNRVMSMTAKSSVDSVRREMITDMKIPLPPLPEQKAIAEVLSDTDDLIQALEKQIAKKRSIKQGVMQELLTPKEGWSRKRLGDVLKIRHGRSQKGIEDRNGKFPILGTGGVLGFTNEYIYDNPSVLIGRKGTIDKPQFIQTPFWTVDTLFYTEINSGNHTKFIYYTFSQIKWNAYNEASGVPSLNAKTIENIEKGFPSFIEQIRIADILSEMDNEISLLEGKLLKLVSLKQGLMQNLLTGKIRLLKS